MQDKLKELEATFKKKVILLSRACNNAGVTMELTEGVRNPFIQGIYWKQSRSEREIRDKITDLRSCKAYFLALCIEASPLRKGPFLTNAIPGISWHQWGEAADFVWIVDGKRCWDINIRVNGQNGYEIYANIAKELGLDSGFFWEGFKDACHIQLRSVASPLKIYDLSTIDYEMQIRFEYLINRRSDVSEKDYT